MPEVLATEKHYTIPEIADLWGASADTVRKYFIDETGVIKLGHQTRKNKRRYVTLLVPESIMKKVHARLAGAVPR